MVLAVVLSFILTLVLGFEDIPVEEQDKERTPVTDVQQNVQVN